MITLDDIRHMRRCLSLARRALGRTSPNPIVGSAIVASGRTLAEGWHRRAGAPHAEADALAKLGGHAKGATLYVSLEPCAHTSARRTQPCVPLLVASGISRLVYGMRDPFPGHGGGLAALARAGILVEGPVLEEECLRANEVFTLYATQRRAHFTLKAAMTLDGRIATASGESRWITGEAARGDVHRLRNRMDALVVGVGTVLADDPLLTTRGIARGRDPARIVLDSTLRMPVGSRMLSVDSLAPTIVVAAQEAPARREKALLAAGARVVRLGRGRVDLASLGKWLAKQDLLHVLVEGGAETHASFLDADLCDRLLLYVAPSVMGGAKAPAWVAGKGARHLADMTRFRFDAKPRAIGDDVLLTAVRVGTR